MDVTAFRLIAAGIALAVAGAVKAQIPNTPLPYGSASQRLLVLVDGRVVSGDLTPRPEGYDVALPAGRVFIPADRIRFEAGSLPEAYQLWRDSMDQRVPENHLALARWCITQELWDGARRELLDAIHLDPGRDDATRLLEVIEQRSQNPASGGGLKSSSVTVMSSGVPPQLATTQSYSLGGLSLPVAQSFVRDVQPLVANKCGNTACHSPGRNRFEVVVPRHGSTPTIAERNLASFLRLVDLTSPRNSAVLVKGLAKHGGMAVPPFRGRTGARQMDVIRNWVFAVAEDLAPARETLQRQETSPDVITTSFSETDLPADDRPSQPSDAGPPLGRMLSTAEQDRDVLNEVRIKNRRDAFNPDVFNQKHHNIGRPDPGALRER